MTTGIYKITNTQTGKCYIGSAIKIERRWNEHKNMLQKNIHHSQRLQNSWNKHGAAAFLFEVLERVDNKEELIQREQHYLDLYESYVRDSGYNMCPNAHSRLGSVQSEDTKRKISDAQKGREFSTEARERMSKAAKGKIMTDETRRKMSEAHKGRVPWNKGVPQPEETKKKISDALKGRPSPNKGNKHTEETIKKMKESRTGTGNARAIFTEEQVREIRKLNKEGISQRKLAEMFNCSRGAIVSAIKKYKNVT